MARFDERERAFTPPPEGAVRNELAGDIKEPVTRLPERERRVFELHTFEGLAFGEVAERLDLENQDRARYLFQRALSLLGDELEEHR